MDEVQRVYGYTGGGGLIQAFAGGYFLWDLVVTVQNVGVFGVGMLCHAAAALCVFSLGFVCCLLRPPLLPSMITAGLDWTGLNSRVFVFG